VVALVIDPDSSGRSLPPELLAQLSEDPDPAAALLAQLERQDASKASIRSDVVGHTPAPNARTSRARPAAAHPSTTNNDLSAAVAPIPQPHDSFSVEPSFSLLVSYGVQPRVRPGATVASRFNAPWRLAITLAATYWLQDTVNIDTPAANGSYVRVNAAQTALFLSYNLVRWDRFGIDAHAGMAAGVRWVRAYALAENRYPVRPYLAPMAGFAARFELSPHWLASGELTAAKLTPRDRYIYTDSVGKDHRLFVPALAAAWVSIGIGYRV
jgi:hypothetical protein